MLVLVLVPGQVVAPAIVVVVAPTVHIMARRLAPRVWAVVRVVWCHQTSERGMSTLRPTGRCARGAVAVGIHATLLHLPLCIAQDESRWPATVDSMLGGFGDKADADARESRAFLKHVFASLPDLGRSRVLGMYGGLLWPCPALLLTHACRCCCLHRPQPWCADVGAGIGRVTSMVLLREFEKADLLEQCERFVAQGKQSMGTDARIGEWFTMGFQVRVEWVCRCCGSDGGS